LRRLAKVTTTSYTLLVARRPITSKIARLQQAHLSFSKENKKKNRSIPYPISSQSISRFDKIPIGITSLTTIAIMIVENKNNAPLKSFNVGSKGSANRKSLLIPSSAQIGGSASGNKNAFQNSTVSKSTSDPALIKSDSVQASEEKAILPTTPSPRTKLVRFDDVILRNLLHSSEQVDPSEIWYSPQDFSRGAKEIQGLVQQVRRRQAELIKSGIKMQNPNGKPPHPELRGVEDLVSPQSFRCRSMRMNQVKRGVLQEQKRQQTLGQRNPLLLSVRCREFSIIAQQLATQRARWDAKEAEACSRQ
jgi:hypothetical protein